MTSGSNQFQRSEGSTRVPTLGPVLSMPLATSDLIASRTTVRLTPSSSPSSGSGGRLAPGTWRPATMASPRRSRLWPSTFLIGFIAAGRRSGVAWRGRYSAAVMPPSTYSTWPLTKAAASLARNTATGASSSTRPQRPIGARLATQALNCSSATSGAVSSVAK